MLPQNLLTCVTHYRRIAESITQIILSRSPAATMKRPEWLMALGGLVFLAVGWQLTRSSHGPSRDIVVVEACRAPVRILEPQAPRPIGSAIVFHGLSANRRLMQTFGQWLASLGLRAYLVDSPGHGDNTEPFSFTRAEQCAGDLVESLAQKGEINLDTTILAGHSMGGAIAIRLADRFPTAATIAISPAPLVQLSKVPASFLPYGPPRRMPVNLLVFVGGWEPSITAQADQALMRAAGGERLQPEDFQQRRAAKLVVIPMATHTSLLYDRRVKDWSLDWARSALSQLAVASTAPGSPVAGGLLGLVGLFLLFPAAASGLALLLRANGKEEIIEPPGIRRVLVLWMVTSLLVVSLEKFWVPLKVLRMMTGDYLASSFLLTGVVLLVFLRNEVRAALRLNTRAVALAGLLGLSTLLVFGAWLDWQLAGGGMNAPRWLRFVPVALVCWPYFAAEEVALGPPSVGRRLGRFALFLALRLELWVALLLALYVFRSGQILIVLLAIYLALLSLVQRWASDAVRRRTGSVAAAAAIGAILTAWFVAAVFPLT